ncbi:MAG: stage II sporulation protein M [Planctomycetota bacterium]
MGTGFVLKSYEFRREREKIWRRLEKLVLRVESSGIKSLSARELEELPQLYRATLSSLSVARSISLDRNVVEFLEALTQRAYFCVYGTKSRLSTAIIDFFVHLFPGMMWRYRRELVLSMAVVFAGTMVGYRTVRQDEGRFYSFVDRSLAQERGPQSSREELLSVLYDEGDRDGEELAIFSASLFNHNAGIGILAFALGFLAGVPTVLLLFQNGLMLGAFWALHANRGISYDLWGWLLIHGVTEILAIMVCGAAGFIIARALIFPGRFTRIENLAIEGRRAGVIVLGAVFMFCLAGFIEGVLRQVVTSPLLRYGFAAASAVAWIWYFAFRGRWSQAKIEGQR